MWTKESFFSNKEDFFICEDSKGDKNDAGREDVAVGVDMAHFPFLSNPKKKGAKSVPG